MFAGFMVDAWIVATLVAVVGGAIGFFVVLRGSAFVAHAVPNGSFAGAAGAALVGVSTLLGLGALFLALSTEYEPEVFSLLFGETLGISQSQVGATLALAILSLLALAVLWRPLMFASVLPESGAARGVRPGAIEVAFLLVVALATTMTVPVVGATLIFSLLIGPPAAARSLTARPGLALVLSVILAVAVVWAAIALSYTTEWPVGFFVGVGSALLYVAGRSWAALACSALARR